MIDFKWQHREDSSVPNDKGPSIQLRILAVTVSVPVSTGDARLLDRLIAEGLSVADEIVITPVRVRDT
jgi:hypothetical protein